MITIDDHTERRRNTLLSNPCQRRTLLKSTEDTLSGQADLPAKRRKGLLSTPALEIPEKISTSVQNGSPMQISMDPKVRKRRALLPESSVQMPTSIVSSSRQCPIETMPLPPSSKQSVPLIALTPSSNGSSSNCTPSNRRVLLSFSMDDKQLSASVPTSTSTSNNGNMNREFRQTSTRPTLLSHSITSDDVNEISISDLDLTRKTNKAIMTESKSLIHKATDMDVHLENDLPWLYEQRSLIDKRIAELQENAQKAGYNKDVVMYINGYYCHACRKLFRGDYNSKMAHCRENAHLINADECANDPESMLKYFEERYDGIEFDDVEDEIISNRLESSTSSQQHSRLNTLSNELIAPENGEQSQTEEDNSDEEEDMERKNGCERFDRTRISRK